MVPICDGILYLGLGCGLTIVRVGHPEGAGTVKGEITVAENGMTDTLDPLPQQRIIQEVMTSIGETTEERPLGAVTGTRVEGMIHETGDNILKGNTDWLLQ